MTARILASSVIVSNVEWHVEIGSQKDPSATEVELGHAQFHGSSRFPVITPLRWPTIQARKSRAVGRDEAAGENARQDNALR